MDKEAP